VGKDSPKKLKPPIVSFQEVPAGRETLAAIAEDLRHLRSADARDRSITKHYGDRISNAPGAVSPKVSRALDTSPEVSVTLTSPGRDTYALIHEEHRLELPDIEVSTVSGEDVDDDEFLDTLEVERVHSFTVLAELEHFQSPGQQARLVERRLLRQIPGMSVEDVTRIEVEEAQESHYLLVRVYTRVLD
jgi:hypothetical protein